MNGLSHSGVPQILHLRYPRFLLNENPAIVVGFHKGFADEQKANKNSA